MKISQALTLCLVSLLTMPAWPQESAGNPAGETAAPATAPAAAGGFQLPEAIELKETDVQSFITVAPALSELGIRAALGTSITDPDRMTEIIAASSEALSLLAQHGFTAQSFPPVAFSIGFARAGLELQRNQTSVDAALAQKEMALAQLQMLVTPDQFAILKRQVEAAANTVTMLRQQPPANLVLVEKYSSQLDALIAGQ
jgi:hypothetical protein